MLDDAGEVDSEVELIAQRTVPASGTVNRRSQRLTSGGSTTSPIVRHSSMNTTTLSVLSMSEDSTAAMNAAG